MRSLRHLFENNRAWSEDLRRRDPNFFTRLTRQQKPQYLWIGCPDSRVPANEIVEPLWMEVFVHRDVPMREARTEINRLPELQYAADVLRARDVIVCGHQKLGGMHSASRSVRLGGACVWLPVPQQLCRKHATVSAGLSGEAAPLIIRGSSQNTSPEAPQPGQPLLSTTSAC